jgi:hypothetical protein
MITNNDGVLIFKENEAVFTLSEHKVSLLLRHIRGLENNWVMPLRADIYYKIQPKGQHWKRKGIGGWKLIYILNHLDEINKVLTLPLPLSSINKAKKAANEAINGFQQKSLVEIIPEPSIDPPSEYALLESGDQIGICIEYLVSGMDGNISDMIYEIYEDQRLKDEVKYALTNLIERIYSFQRTRND